MGKGCFLCRRSVDLCVGWWSVVRFLWISQDVILSFGRGGVRFMLDLKDVTRIEMGEVDI